ncbi:MAG: protein kinase [Firmicutes bacterium]|nr:protein kinase [Bacillota bacterium]
MKSVITKYEPLWGKWYGKKQIGEGRFTKVFRIDTDDGDSSALKVITIPDSLLKKPEEIKSIITEVLDKTSSLSHKNILSNLQYTSYDHENNKGFDYLIRENIFDNLPDYICDNSMSSKGIIKLGIDIASALEYSHSKGIIHSDIRSENIFYDSNSDSFLLTDFALNQAVNNALNIDTVSNYEYLPPESYSNNIYNESSDIYSLAVVLYKLLNKNMIPFLSEDKYVIYKDVEDAIAHRMSGAELSAPISGTSDISDVILKAADPSPSRRYSSASEFKAALSSLLSSAADKAVVTEDDILNEITPSLGIKEIVEKQANKSLFSVIDKKKSSHKFEKYEPEKELQKEEPIKKESEKEKNNNITEPADITAQSIAAALGEEFDEEELRFEQPIPKETPTEQPKELEKTTEKSVPLTDSDNTKKEIAEKEELKKEELKKEISKKETPKTNKPKNEPKKRVSLKMDEPEKEDSRQAPPVQDTSENEQNTSSEPSLPPAKGKSSLSDRKEAHKQKKNSKIKIKHRLSRKQRKLIAFIFKLIVVLLIVWLLYILISAVIAKFNESQALPDNIEQQAINVEKSFVHADEIEVERESVRMIVGDEFIIKGKVIPTDALEQTIEYTTKDTDIIHLNNNKVRALSEGKATVTLSAGSVEKKVFFYVDTNVETAVVPDLVGKTREEAVKILEDANIPLGHIEEFRDSNAAINIVNKQEPASGTNLKLDMNAAVNISVCIGKPTVKIPNLVGLTENEAKTQLDGLYLNVSEDYSDTIPTGRIIRQSETPDSEMERGQTLAVVISKGADPEKNTQPTTNAAPVSPAPAPAPQPATQAAPKVEQPEVQETSPTPPPVQQQTPQTPPPSVPSANMDPGDYASYIYVTLNAEPGAEIWYTTSGMDPKDERFNKRYYQAIPIESSCTLRAVAVKNGVTSAEISYRYNIGS